MKINIYNLIEGAKQAKGLTVIIDVFRAFSTACYVINNGAKEIIPVGDINEAYKLKKQNPEFILLGERDAKKPEGFDYGNSPTEIEHENFTNKTVVQTTSSGTQGIVNATQADEIITGSFVNAQAIINYIKKQNPKEVSLVAMGHKGILNCDEDQLFTQYIKNALENKPMSFREIKSHLRNYISAEKFFNKDKPWAPKRDFYLCLNLNKFNFVLKYENSKFTTVICPM